MAALPKEEQGRAAAVATATAVGVAAGPGKQGLITVATVIDQHKEDEISILDPAIIKVAYARYKAW